MDGARSEGVAAAAAVWYGRARSGAITAGRRVAAVPAPLMVGAFVLGQWAVTLAIARSATHDGWLYYHGGDGTYYWTTIWSLAHHHVPETIISYGIPVFLWPLGLVFGPNMLVGLPGLVLFQVLVLAPLGVVTMYALASRIGGRLFGYAATLVWILAPPIVLALFRSFGEPPFDDKVHDLVFPNAMGLTTLADYTSMILALASTFFVLRAIEDRRWDDVVLAGLSAGLLLAVKPANGYWLAVPLVAFAARRRWREGLVFAGCLVPALITLTIWKKIGLGYIPAAAPETRRVAMGATAVPVSLRQYELLDWDVVKANFWWLSDATRGFEAMLLLWIVGMVGLIRRIGLPGLMITTWCLVYLFFKGGAAGRASVENTSAFRLVIPSYPAFVLLLVAGAFVIVSAALLVPWQPRRTRAAAVPMPPTRVSVVAAVVLAAYPFLFIVTTSGWGADRVAKDTYANTLFPVSNELRPVATVEKDGILVSWRRPRSRGTHVYFELFRSTTGNDCNLRTSGARDCYLAPTDGVFTTQTHYLDRRPAGPVVSYRVAMRAGWAGDLPNSDILMAGPPVVVHPPQR